MQAAVGATLDEQVIQSLLADVGLATGAEQSAIR